MDADFWHDKWKKQQIGFHLDTVNPWLVSQLPLLTAPLAKDCAEPARIPARILVPLCGKTLDIDYLLQQGLQVVGCELSELAVEQLFARLEKVPTISEWSAGKLYQCANLWVFVGDFFALTPTDVGSIDWVYDRAALVALPKPMRDNYAKHIQALSPTASMLLITLQYDQLQMSGPPFSVIDNEVAECYGKAYDIQTVKQKDLIEQEPRFKQQGLTAFIQTLFVLRPLALPITENE